MKIVLLAGLLLAGVQAWAAAVVLYEDRVVDVQEILPDPTDLWIHPDELGRVNGFELKPEGACIDDICVPVRQNRDSDIFVTRQGRPWFNVVALAQRLNQPYVADHDTGVWSFGAIPVQRASFLDDAVAPDFTLPGIDGKHYSLSDFKGMKVMLLSWASW
jgi:AhpC/TSA family